MLFSSSNGIFESHSFSGLVPSQNSIVTSGSVVPESVEQETANYFLLICQWMYRCLKLLLKSTKSIAFFASLSSMSRAPFSTSNLTISIDPSQIHLNLILNSINVRFELTKIEFTIQRSQMQRSSSIYFSLQIDGCTVFNQYICDFQVPYRFITISLVLVLF